MHCSELNLSTSCSIYFFPMDVARVQCLLRATCTIYSAGQKPTLSISTYVSYGLRGRTRRGETTYPMGTLVRRSHPYRSGAELCKLLRIKAFPSLLQVVSFAILRRHGHTVNTKERAMFWRAQADQLDGEPALSGGRQSLLQLQFPTAAGVLSFLRLVHCVNAQTNLVDDDGSRLIMRFMLPQATARLSFASAAQGAMRGHIARLRMTPTLGTAVLAVRSIR